jgi:subfamily B ATP-binding cassette protein MsbA
MSFYLRALRYFRKDLPGILLSLFLILLSTLAGLLQPFPLAILIDSVLGNKPAAHWITRLFMWITPEGMLPRIIALAAITLGLRIIQELLVVAQSLAAIKVGYAGLMRVRCDLYEKLQALSLSYHKSQPQGDAIQRLSYDTSGIQTILNVFINAILVSSVTLIIMACIMMTMSWQLTLVALSIAPILLWLTQYGTRVIKQRWMLVKDVDTQLTTAIQRSVAAISLVQAFCREADEYARFRSTVRSSVSSYIRVHWVELLYGLMIGVVFGVGGAVIFGYGGYLVYRDQYLLNLGERGMTVGSLYIFLMYLTQLYAPLQRLTGAGATLQGGAVAAERVFEVLDRDPVITDAPDAVSLPVVPRTLEIDHISFEYRKGTPVFEDVAITFKPGDMIGLVGFSGVGKTTLLNLLPRFYDPTKGSIKLDGHDIRKIKIRDLRKHMAMVLQESIVLPATIAENIAYGKPDATDAQIRAAAELAQAAEFIDRLPEKYDTQVSESGSNLSGGQRQRLAIARALLTEAPILVLDEPTSALDPQNELLIVQTLYGLKRSRTIILVSHRLSTVADCDRIYVMGDGKIQESGTHNELLAHRGLYWQMAKHQMKLVDVTA